MAWLYAKNEQVHYNIGTATTVKLVQGNDIVETHVLIVWPGNTVLRLYNADDADEALRWCEKHSESW